MRQPGESAITPFVGRTPILATSGRSHLALPGHTPTHYTTAPRGVPSQHNTCAQ